MFREFFEKVKSFFTGEKKSKPKIGESVQGIDIQKFETVIQYKIHQPELFVEALLHRSYLQYPEAKERKSNERLEFLGDSILNLIIAEYLYHHFPEAEEGELTKIRSRLVNRKALAIYARELRLNEFMFMSSSAAQSLEKGSDSILADAYEAVIAAIYLDGGYEAAKKFVKRMVLAAMSKGVMHASDDNYKSRLLEYSQAKGLGIPKYNILKEEGPDHDRTFTVEVIMGSERLGIGVGRSKKDAEQAAALKALEKIQEEQVNQSA